MAVVSLPPAKPSGDPVDDYPGAALGLPPRGPASLAPILLRGVAAAIDWLLCQLIAIGLLDVSPADGGSGSLVPLGLFLLMHLVLVGTIGTTIGHKIVGIEVRAQDGGSMSPTRTLVRTLMVALFFPAILTANDGRGLHDKAAGAMTIRTR